MNKEKCMINMLKKNSILFLIFILVIVFQNCKTNLITNDKVINIENPGNHNNIYPLIQAAVDMASEGDIISLPRGEFYIDDRIEIKNFISIVGQGSDVGGTMIYWRNDLSEITLSKIKRMIWYYHNSSESSNVVVSDIHFKGKDPSTNSMIADSGIGFDGYVDFIVKNCKFSYFGYAGIFVKHKDNLARGLIYNNKFYHNVKGPDALGLGYGVVIVGDNYDWVSDPMFGSENFVFIEDNKFTDHRHSIAAGGAAKYVFRFNEVINNLWGHAIDAHGGRDGSPGDSNYYSTRAYEVYNNHIYNTKFRDGTPIESGHNLNDLVGFAVIFKGGEGLFYNNIIDNFLNGINLVEESKGVYPIRTQIGYLSGLYLGVNHIGINMPEGDGDFFEWNNTFVAYIPEIKNRKFRNFAEKLYVEGRDYHLETQKPKYTAYEYPHPLRND